jgi:actin-related protein
VLEDEEVGLPSPSEPQDVELPDGQTFTLSRERCDAPELLFRPSLISSEDMGVHELVGECLKVSDIDIRKDLMANIVTSGGNTMFPGFCRRLRHEVVECLRERMTLTGFVNVKVTEQPDRDCAAWIGGAIAASLPQFQDEV